MSQRTMSHICPWNYAGDFEGYRCHTHLLMPLPPAMSLSKRLQGKTPYPGIHQDLLQEILAPAYSHALARRKSLDMLLQSGRVAPSEVKQADEVLVDLYFLAEVFDIDISSD